MRCALINLSTTLVINIIIADAASDAAPEGHSLVNIADDSPVWIGWSYDPVTEQFSQPE